MTPPFAAQARPLTFGEPWDVDDAALGVSDQDGDCSSVVAGFDRQQRYFFACWWLRFRLLVQFRQVFPERWPKHEERFPNDVQIGRWVTEQRKAITAGTMRPERLVLLRSIGFPLDPIVPLEDAWWAQARLVQAFRRDCPKRWPRQLEEYPAGNRLGAWCSTQRQVARDGKLADDRLAFLRDLGFPFHTFNVQWNAQYDYVKQYRKRNPDRWPTKGEEFPAGNDLGTWLCTQRVRFRHGNLSPARQRKLVALGFAWQVSRWETQLAHLAHYRALHPDRWPTRSEEFPPGNALAVWMCTQRLERKRGALSPERQRLLDELCFPWKGTRQRKAR